MIASVINYLNKLLLVNKIFWTKWINQKYYNIYFILMTIGETVRSQIIQYAYIYINDFYFIHYDNVLRIEKEKNL